MDTVSSFKVSTREARPLHPLSPERVNAVRPMSTTTSITTRSSKRSDSTSQREDPFHSPQSSPSRRNKADLFAGFDLLGSPPRPTTSGFALPQSPSLPEIHALRGHARTNSDVQGLVKRFEHLDVRDRDAESADRRKKHEAELRRAQIAREEAESDVKRLREETRRLKKERDEGLERERIIGKRLEVVVEEFGTHKESNSSQSGLYEKELRKARKEAFKSSSAVVKLQEELKSTRATLRVSQSALDLEKQKLQRKEQERFEMEYQLVPLQDQMEKLQQKLKVVEEERDTLKESLKAEELARIASEGRIALPASQEADADLMSPRRSPQKLSPSPLSDDKENEIPVKKSMDIRRLAADLQRERILRENAEELADFLRTECMFRCCSCKTASRLERDLALRLDGELAARVETIQNSMAEVISTGHISSEPLPVKMDVEVTRGVTASPIATHEAIDIKAEAMLEHEMHDAEEASDSDANTAGSIIHIENVPDSPSAQLMREEEQEVASRTPSPAHVQPPPQESFVASTPEPVVKVPLRPETPPHHSESIPYNHQHSVRTVTTTTTIPMHFTPVVKPALRMINRTDSDEEAENVPPASAPPKSSAHDAAFVATTTFDRAAALAAIADRRGRARSFAAGHATPRKQMVEGVRERRDISAPTLGQKAAGSNLASSQGSASAGKRRGSVGRHVRR